MSIHPDYAQAILAGTKTIEFRKRRIADDVTHVVIYVTRPVAAVVGLFAVGGQVTASPEALWESFKNVAGISRAGFFDYYACHSEGTGIQVKSVHRFAGAYSLREAVGVDHPPQSYQYLASGQAQRLLDLVDAVSE